MLRIETRAARYDDKGIIGLPKDRQFKLSLVRVIRSLQNVKAVRWEIQGLSLLESVLEGLIALPQLEELHLRFMINSTRLKGYSPMFHLNQFSQLRRIAVVNSRGGEFFEDLTKQLAEVIMKSPLLEHLRYVWPTTAMELRNISTLSISGQVSSTYENIWLFLSEAGIHLKDISVATMDQHLANYLMSYSGLEKFSLTFDCWSTVAKCNLESARFYADVLPRHKESLTCLVISSSSPEHWCMNSEHVNSVLKCRNLKQLSITLDFDGIQYVEVVVGEFNYHT
ncbi:hypothetical protein B0H34DRAFT_701225 [Crassisporium funariophilum]|nr:hypothetical protein B0H34DRAFT_701225 [Crassisporium funariophilum]